MFAKRFLKSDSWQFMPAKINLGSWRSRKFVPVKIPTNKVYNVALLCVYLVFLDIRFHNMYLTRHSSAWCMKYTIKVWFFCFIVSKPLDCRCHSAQLFHGKFVLDYRIPSIVARHKKIIISSSFHTKLKVVGAKYWL